MAMIVPYKTVATIAGDKVFFVEYREEGRAPKAIPLPAGVRLTLAGPRGPERIIHQPAAPSAGQ
ncbi:MAG: hypothetical protein NTV86_19545 [Planctomycetota bacterium]|nr:hypothetical protein [Planctomycetota bacterium]